MHGFFRSITCTSCCTLLAIFHPIVCLLPTDYFVLRPGNYRVNAMAYGLYVLKDILMNFAEFKYLLIAIERHIAFRRRSNYEHQSSRTAWRIIGGFQTIRLHKYASDHRFGCSTLSERFQVQEVINTTQLMRHLLIAFLLSIVGCSILMARWYYLVLWRGISTQSIECVALSNGTYLFVAFYSFGSLVCTVFYFRPLRKQLYVDLNHVFCGRFRSVAIKPFIPTAHDHFVNLQEFWSRT
ncbi:hypothetical protein M3Y94_00088900 [Aphelenchoides besseyi]|nr:hypothetical protein M3Y94_00088900 [Aphelenchoides besseyi]